VVVHVPREGAEHRDELLLLQLPKDKIEVHVKELEVEIGGDKAGEVVVVIVLVDVKKLDVVLGHDHESVAGQCLLHTRGKGLELVRVGEVAQVHAVAFGDGEVLLQQLALAGLHSVDEGLTLLLRPAVLTLLASGTEVERRCSDVDVTILDERTHIAEEEGQDERGDMTTVHVSIGHDDHLVVAKLCQVERHAIFLCSDGHP